MSIRHYLQCFHLSIIRVLQAIKNHHIALSGKYFYKRLEENYILSKSRNHIQNNQNKFECMEHM